MITINVVKTDKDMCFISDCNESSGYDYNYHNTKLIGLLFDGASPTQTLHKNWWKLDNFPDKVTKKVRGEVVESWWELNNPDLESKAMPARLESIDHDSDIYYHVYTKKSKASPDYFVDVEVEWKILAEVNNFKMPPVISYPYEVKVGWDKHDKTYTNLDLQHDLVDTLIIPYPALQASPCSIGREQLYAIIRKHVQNNIDPKVAFIDSDHDFCFSVKKKVNLLQEEKYTYNNPFARTKKDRQKIHTRVNKTKSFTVFSMAPKAYQSYPVLTELVSENEWQLKEDLDEMLSNIMDKINAPLKQCKCCNGTGYILEE